MRADTARGGLGTGEGGLYSSVATRGNSWVIGAAREGCRVIQQEPSLGRHMIKMVRSPDAMGGKERRSGALTHWIRSKVVSGSLASAAVSIRICTHGRG